MARKHNGESSDDDSRDKGDGHRNRHKRKRGKQNRGRNHGDREENRRSERSRSSDKEEDDDKRADRGRIRKRDRERIRDDDDKNRRKGTLEGNSDPSDESEETRDNRDKRTGRDRSNRHRIERKDLRNDRRPESENDLDRNRDQSRRSRHESDNDDEDRRRSRRRTRGENRSDDREPESENDRYRNRDQHRHSRYELNDDGNEDHRRRPHRRTEGENRIDDRVPESENDMYRNRDPRRRMGRDSDDSGNEDGRRRSRRSTEEENRSDDRVPESENDRYRNRDQYGRARHDSNDSDEDCRRRSRRSMKGENRNDRIDNNNQPDIRNRDDNSFKEKVEREIKQKQAAPQETNLNGDTTNLGRSGGVYIPPFKLARMMKETQDKSSVEYQRLTWDALRKSINGLVNKVNATNIKNIVPELFAENLIRGRGLLCRSCMKSQMASPGFTDVFAALVAVVNTKFPEVGDLLLRRIVLQLKRAYKRNDKPQLLAAVKFIAHLVNQQVAHEIIALELLTVLLENPTDDSVEVAVGFVTECGSLLQDVSPKGLHGIFERFRGILHEGEIDKRVQFLIEGLFAIRKAKFQGYPAVRPELDLVEQEDQLTHEISLQDEIDPEIALDIFKPDPQFLENEKRYEELKKSILGEESEDEDGSDSGSGDDEDDEEDECDEEDEEQVKIKDETETNLVNLRRTIYLTIMSSVDFEEAGHKLLKIKLEPGQEMELCIMLLECCSQERTYLRYYGLLGQRFCMINKVYQENFDKCFVQQYSMIHRLETNKLRNVAKFFAHLLGTDALPWHVLAYIRLTEEDTTSSSRIFIKILFQELSEHLGIRRLNDRLSDPTMQDSFESIFPRDNPKNARFSINFFTSIGLGGITENLREYLKNMPRLIMQQQKLPSESESGDDSRNSSSSDPESARYESKSHSSSSDESERQRKKRRR